MLDGGLHDDTADGLTHVFNYDSLQKGHPKVMRRVLVVPHLILLLSVLHLGCLGLNEEPVFFSLFLRRETERERNNF